MKVGLVWTVWEQEEVLPAIASGVYARDRHEVYWEQECKLYGGSGISCCSQEQVEEGVGCVQKIGKQYQHVLKS